MKKKLTSLVLFFLLLTKIFGQHIQNYNDEIELKLGDYTGGEIKWQYSTDGKQWENIENSNKQIFKTLALNSGLYRANVSFCSTNYYSDITQIFVAKTDTEYVDVIGKYLSSDELQGRYPGTQFDTLSVSFLSEILKKNQLAPINKDTVYHKPFITSGSSLAYRNGITTFNVIGVKEGTDPILKKEFIIISSHYDAYGKNTTGVLNGADDNVSGVTAVALLSRKFKDVTTKRSLIFIFTGAEEFGLMGMSNFVKSNFIERNKIKGVLNLDTIGKMKKDSLYIFGDQLSEFIKEKIKFYNTESLNLYLSSATFILGTIADHNVFYNWAPAIGFIAIPNLKGANVHSPNDDWSTINVKGIVKITSLAYKVIFDLANY